MTMVVWLIGKSGAGKTAIGQALYQKLKAAMPGVVFLDGDELRAAVGEDLGYSVEDRRTSERRTSRLCKLLCDQGIHVVCAKLSNAPDIREWNRRNIADYREIYLRAGDARPEELDTKGLYRGYRRGEIDNVVGMDIPFHEPTAPWMTIDNDRRVGVDRIADDILATLEAGVPS